MSPVTGCIRGVLNGVQAVCVGRAEWGIEDCLLAAESENIVVRVLLACCGIPTIGCIVDWVRRGCFECVQVLYASQVYIAFFFFVR